MSNPKIIAFYLPQYHPTLDNDKWWGKGFTEWTNVGKAKPLFPGHYQPKVPADLGYYDLRLPEVREAQAELAKEAGIYGFCYYHYWFGNGKQELELPFNEVLRLGKPDFPFMLCWANESWHKKFWDKDGKGTSREMLVEQTYPGDQDIIDHFYHLLPAFKDPRYIKIDEKPAFMVYRPLDHPKISKFISIWNELAKKEGLNGFSFIAYYWSKDSQDTYNKLRKLGFNKIGKLGMWTAARPQNRYINKIDSILHNIFHFPKIVDMKKINNKIFTEWDASEDIYPTIVPNWDHTPRSGKSGMLFKNADPMMFQYQIEKIIKLTKNKKDNIIFLKSWNEWGEGNYVEPDMRFGNGFLKAIKTAIERNQN